MDFKQTVKKFNQVFFSFNMWQHCAEVNKVTLVRIKQSCYIFTYSRENTTQATFLLTFDLLNYNMAAVCTIFQYIHTSN